jgi:hypothetical protein
LGCPNLRALGLAHAGHAAWDRQPAEPTLARKSVSQVV